MKEETKPSLSSSLSLNALSESIEEEDESVKSLPTETEIFFDVQEDESSKPSSKKSRKKSAVDQSSTQSTNQSSQPTQSTDKNFSDTFVSLDINDQLENYLITVYNNPDSPDYNDDVKLENYVNELENKLKAESEVKKKVRKQQVKEQKIEAVSSRSEANIKSTLSKVSSEWIESTTTSYKSIKNTYEEEIAAFFKKYDGVFIFPAEARMELDNIKVRYPLYISSIESSIVENKIKSFAENLLSYVLNNYSDETLDERVKILNKKLKSFDYTVQLKDELRPLIKSRSRIF